MTHDSTTSTEPAPEPSAPTGEDAPDRAAPADDDTSPGATALERERDELRDRLLRTAAEFDNFRKRVDRERRELAEAASIDLIRDLLPLVDDLERALQVEATGDEAEAYRRGFEIIYRQLLEVLRKRGVTPIEAVGRPFDPQYHEAAVHEPSATHADGEVIGEVRRGYMIGERLLRPSMVRVAKA